LRSIACYPEEVATMSCEFLAHWQIWFKSVERSWSELSQMQLQKSI